MRRKKQEVWGKRVGKRGRANGHVVDRGPRSGAERVPRNTARERGKSVVVRDANDDPLDDIGVSQDADIHERSAPRVDALE